MCTIKSIKIAFIFSIIILFAASLISTIAWATPDQDPFYFAKPQPGAVSGDIIDVRESVFTIDALLHTPFPEVNAWQVMYQSENATGEVIAVSGTVLVPTKSWPDGERPIVGYSVGTRGLGDACAPSYTLSQGYDYESPSIVSMLERGWAVVISDYEGLGTPGEHAYMVGPSQGRVALDIIRAAQSLSKFGLSSDAPIILMGYSQGGAAAGWASELAASYAPELNIVAAVLGGVPADLEATGRFLQGTAFAGFAMMGSVGLNAAYEELDLLGRLNEKGRKLHQQSKGVCIVSFDGDSTTLLETPFRRFDYYANGNPIDDPLWQYYMGLSKLGTVAPKMPVYLYHGNIDQIVPFEPAAELRRDWCDLGAVVEWHPSIDLHLSALYAAQIIAIDWIEERIAGVPGSGNCSQNNRSFFTW
jgi:predicted esterase